MSMIRLDADAIRERQRIVMGRHTCGPRPQKGFGNKVYTPCPFYYECHKRPQHLAALCELEDDVVGIDPTTESPWGGWNFELTIKATKVIEDPLDFGEDEDE